MPNDLTYKWHQNKQAKTKLTDTADWRLPKVGGMGAGGQKVQTCSHKISHVIYTMVTIGNSILHI